MKNEALTTIVYRTIKKLYDHGVHEVVISPGSRSTPLAMACELHPYMKTYIHPDERSAAFFAIGLIKATKKPVAVICTSGTAAANYMPAAAESAISRLPLVILTSDRPHELRNIGAPQAIDQVRMFTNYVRYEVDFPIPDDASVPFVDATVLKAAAFFTGPLRGPIHFNMPFREPLVPDLEAVELMEPEPVHEVTYQKSFNLLPLKHVLRQPKGMIFVGDCQNEDLSQLLTFATIHQLPIFADPLSQLRHLNHPHVLPTADLLFKVYKGLTPDFIIRVGKPMVSKAVNQWLAQQQCPQILVQNVSEPDTYPIVPLCHLEMTANDCFRQLSEESPLERKAWLNIFQHINALIVNVIHQHVGSIYDEGTAFAKILSKIPAKTVLFLGNSMPIRDADTYLEHQVIPYCNRGANGIDGVVSTAMGMAMHQTVTLIIGDISFYHDMNGLIMKKMVDAEHLNINIIVMNNNGGGIFSYLPQSKETDLFERLFGTPLNLDFKHTAALYDFKYHQYDVFEDFQLPKYGANIIEVATDRTDNVEAHQALTEKVREVLHAELSIEV